MSNPFVPPSELRWLYVDFNSYFASVEQQINPALRGKPIAVIPVATDATCAIAASYEAKAFGVKTGTPIYEAKKMCPGIICVLADHKKYLDYHERLVDEVDKHIPVEAVCSIDEMACKLGRSQKSPEEAFRLGKEIKEGIFRNVGEYLRCSVGVAPNRYLSKVATEMQKPNGLIVLMPNELPDRLCCLKLRDLPGIGANVERRLNDAGIVSMNQLLSLQPKHMRALWGNLWGERMWYMLRGFDVPDVETKRSTVGHSHVLSPEMRGHKEAWLIAKRLTSKAASRLRRMEYYAGGFSLSLRTEAGAKYGLDIKCKPSQDSFTFLRIVEEMWAQIMTEANFPRVKKISVTLHALTASNEVQMDLFDVPQSDKDERQKKSEEKLSHVIDGINKRFGKDAIMLGMTELQGRSFTGTKIAFTRIPDLEEFDE